MDSSINKMSQVSLYPVQCKYITQIISQTDSETD